MHTLATKLVFNNKSSPLPIVLFTASQNYTAYQVTSHDVDGTVNDGSAMMVMNDNGRRRVMQEGMHSVHFEYGIIVM